MGFDTLSGGVVPVPRMARYTGPSFVPLKDESSEGVKLWVLGGLRVVPSSVPMKFLWGLVNMGRERFVGGMY